MRRSGVVQQMSHGGSVAEPYYTGGFATLISDPSSGRLLGASWRGVAAVAEPLGSGQLTCDSMGVSGLGSMTSSVRVRTGSLLCRPAVPQVDTDREG